MKPVNIRWSKIWSISYHNSIVSTGQQYNFFISVFLANIWTQTARILTIWYTDFTTKGIYDNKNKLTSLWGMWKSHDSYARIITTIIDIIEMPWLNEHRSNVWFLSRIEKRKPHVGQVEYKRKKIKTYTHILLKNYGRRKSRVLFHGSILTNSIYL